jgi:Tol biopolymer transport system component
MLITCMSETTSGHLLFGASTNLGGFVGVIDIRDGKRVLLDGHIVTNDAASCNAVAYDADSGMGFVVFESKQRNLVKNDTNEKSDIFVHDRATKKTRRVSVRTNGTQGDDASRDPSISGDGRFVVYESLATNLINNDTNGRVDIYVRDRKKGKTKRVSVRSDGTESMDGQADDPVISGDGRMIAWEDSADDLAGAGNIDEGDIFIRDRKKNKTRRVSVSTAGVAGDDGSLSPAFSGDGRFVLFESDATNLVSVLTVDDRDVYIRGPLR